MKIRLFIILLFSYNTLTAAEKFETDVNNSLSAVKQAAISRDHGEVVGKHALTTIKRLIAKLFSKSQSQDHKGISFDEIGDDIIRNVMLFCNPITIISLSTTCNNLLHFCEDNLFWVSYSKFHNLVKYEVVFRDKKKLHAAIYLYKASLGKKTNAYMIEQSARLGYPKAISLIQKWNKEDKFNLND